MKTLTVLLFLASSLRVMAPPAELEIDWEAVSDVGTTLVEQWQSGALAEKITALAGTIEVDWREVGKLADEALRQTSWEDAAALRPLVDRAIDYLGNVENAEATIDWLNRRREYLLAAERYVAGSRVPTKPTKLPPPPPVPVPTRAEIPALPVPQPPPPAPKPVHRVDIPKDVQAWKSRLPHNPPGEGVRLAPVLKKIFTEEGIPPALIWLAEVESAFNPRALSPAGASGLYQFMPATASRFGLRTRSPDERLHPERSATAAAQYLRYLHGIFKDWPLALAAYNAGEGRVGRTLKNRQAKSFSEVADHLPIETRMYVPRVMAVVAHREGMNVSDLPAPETKTK